MKNEEKLLLGIGEISEDIIAEASAEYKRKFTLNKKTLSIAASVAVVALTIALLPGLLLGRFNKNDAGGDAAPEMDGGMMNGSADVREEDFGTLIYKGKKADGTFSFTLIIVTEAPKPIDVYLYSQDNTIVYTTAQSVSDVTEIRRPTITVNGEAKDAIPAAAGEYDITIRFDGLEETVKWKSLFRIENFGDFHRKDFVVED